jgi:hypothetical protein
MMDVNVKPHRRTREKTQAETTNRDGHWTRVFAARTDPWLGVGAWASNHGYTLAALRGKRRLYRKQFSSRTVVWVDIKEHEGRMTLSAWLRFAFWSRALHGFALPEEMNPSPHGWLGAFARRTACRDLNALLASSHQAPILGSQSFHPADLDPSTFWLAGLSLIPLAVFCAGTLPEWELRLSVLPVLFAYWGQRASWLVVAIAAAVVAQEAGTRWLRANALKIGSVVALLTAITSFSVVSLSRSSREARETELAYHCLRVGEAPACRELMESLPPDRRLGLLQHLQSVEQQLAVKDRPARHAR